MKRRATAVSGSPIPPPLKFVPLDKDLYRYVLRHQSQSHDPVLDDLRAETEKLGSVSEMLISGEQGSFLTLLTAALGVRSAIEVGTFTGYSAICIARGLSSRGRLLCIDINEEWTAIGRRFWKRAGLDKKIELRLGGGKSELQALSAKYVFDLAFIDADKPGYDLYYELLLPHVRPNGLIIFDNMLQHGRVTNPQDQAAQAIDGLNKKLCQDPRVECVLLTVADGLMLCRKR
ncbi:MAG TPA: class I SAM-dependent methyltransferase [Terrimicrobiaceae bacterium]